MKEHEPDRITKIAKSGIEPIYIEQLTNCLETGTKEELDKLVEELEEAVVYMDRLKGITNDVG